MGLVETLKQSWRNCVVILIPLALTPLVFPYSTTSSESKCAFMLVTMAVYWVTEALPLPVTSLLAIGLSPLLGIASSSALCKVFFADIVFLLLGGIFVAVAVEECNLHKRFALKILLMIGVQPKRLLFGLMTTTWFLSMWISNTATTAMMMPITRSLLAKLFSSVKKTKVALEQGQGRIKVDDGIGGLGNLDDRDVSHRAEFKSDEDGQSGDHVVDEIGRAKCELESSYVRMSDPGDDRDKEELVIQQEEVPQLPGFSDNEFPGEVLLDPTEVELRDFSTTAKNQINNDILHQHEGKVNHFASTLEEPSAVQEPVNDKEDVDEEVNDESEENPLLNISPQMTKMLKIFSIAICYSANIGGIATLTGTVPNLVLVRVALELSDGNERITFASWMSFAFLISFLTLALVFIWLCFNIFGVRNTLLCRSDVSEEEIRQTRSVIESEYKNLGQLKFSEKMVLGHFLALVTLWLSRNPGTVGGWGSLFKDKYVTDGMTAMFIGVLLFVFPSERPNVLFFRKKGDTSPSRSMPSLLSWKVAAVKFPWGTVFLLGGGFALAEATKISGLSSTISDTLYFLKHVPVWSASLIVTLITIAATEITSNTVICVLILPILGNMAIDMGVHPLYFMMPVTAGATMAFMLPVATPPNALVFAYGDVKVTDMIKTGLLANGVGMGVIFLAVNTWGMSLFDLDTFPDWASDERNARLNLTSGNLTGNIMLNDVNSTDLSVLA